MAARILDDLVIDDLRGGMNDEDPPQALRENEVVEATNVEFFLSTLGERRRGSETVSLTDSNLDDEEGIIHLSTHLAALAEPLDTELFAVALTDGVSYTIARRDAAHAWTNPTVKDGFTLDLPEAAQIQAASGHNKWFVCYKPADVTIDRMHLWDGSTVRRAGLAPPALAPVVANSAAAGAFTGARTYRVRFIVKSGSTILRRSEPSPEVSITPDTTHSGILITKPATVNEGETHWEIEADDDTGDFYVVTTLAVAVTTYTDTTALTSSYADGVLSEDIGDYENLPAAKFVKFDQDRTIFAGHWLDAEKDSRVMWSPVYNDPGVGNDERLPTGTDNYLDMDWMEGGGFTGLSDPMQGSFYTFKQKRIYKFQRSGRRAKAYDAYLLTKERGAVYGSVVNGVDEYGQGAIYFIDPSLGPSRISARGMQTLRGLRGTWRRVNTGAETIIANGVYYPEKEQIHWFVAVDGSDTPNYEIVLQTSAVVSGADGTRGGWCVATGRSTEAWCSVMMPELVDEGDNSIQLTSRPYVGLTSPDYIQRKDMGSTDNGEVYRARILTKPYIVAGLLNHWGAMVAALLAEPNNDASVTINVKFNRDFDMEEQSIVTDFVPKKTESKVIKVFDDLKMSEATTIQVEFSDPE